MKEKYINAKIEVVQFEAVDVILTSGGELIEGGDED